MKYRVVLYFPQTSSEYESENFQVVKIHLDSFPLCHGLLQLNGMDVAEANNNVIDVNRTCYGDEYKKLLVKNNLLRKTGTHYIPYNIDNMMITFFDIPEHFTTGRKPIRLTLADGRVVNHFIEF